MVGHLCPICSGLGSDQSTWPEFETWNAEVSRKLKSDRLELRALVPSGQTSTSEVRNLRHLVQSNDDLDARKPMLVGTLVPAPRLTTRANPGLQHPGPCPTLGALHGAGSQASSVGETGTSCHQPFCPEGVVSALSSNSIHCWSPTNSIGPSPKFVVLLTCLRCGVVVTMISPRGTRASEAHRTAQRASGALAQPQHQSHP